MKPSYLLFSFIFSILLFSSCQKDLCFTKDQFLDSYNSFITELEKVNDEITEKEKEEYEQRFKSIVEQCYKKYKPELSLKERQDFWKESVKYYVVKEGNEININLSSLETEFEKYVESEIQEIIEDSGTAFFNSLEEIMEDNLPKFLNSVAKEIEKFADDLEKAFEEN